MTLHILPHGSILEWDVLVTIGLFGFAVMGVVLVVMAIRLVRRQLTLRVVCEGCSSWIRAAQPGSKAVVVMTSTSPTVFQCGRCGLSVEVRGDFVQRSSHKSV